MCLPLEAITHRTLERGSNILSDNLTMITRFIVPDIIKNLLKEMGSKKHFPALGRIEYILCIAKLIKMIDIYLYIWVDGFGGLVVSTLSSGTHVYGFKPSRSRWNFTDVKILSMPSSGGEVKESVPCPSFATCKRT